MEAITNFFDSIQSWLDSGVYTFATEWAAYFIEKAVIGYIGFMKMAIPFAWGVAKQILQDLNISTYIAQAFDSLPSSSQAIAIAFKIPECVNTAISGFVTRFVIKFIPGL